eukprot:UN25044
MCVKYIAKNSSVNIGWELLQAAQERGFEFDQNVHRSLIRRFMKTEQEFEAFEVYQSINGPSEETHMTLLDLYCRQWNDKEDITNPELVLRILETLLYQNKTTNTEEIDFWIAMVLMKLSYNGRSDECQKVIKLCLQNGKKLESKFFINTLLCMYGSLGNVEKIENLIESMKLNKERIKAIS